MCVCVLRDRVFFYAPGFLNVAGAVKGQALDSKHARLVSLADRIRMVCGKFIDLAKCPHAKAVAFRKARVEQYGRRCD